MRGIAALGVVFSHCFYTFFPYLQTGEVADQRTAWEFWLFNSPFRSLYNGTFAVAVFFLMSGYVLTRRFFNYGDYRSLQEGAVKRYIRLALPAGASIMLCSILMEFHRFAAKDTDLSSFIRHVYIFEPSLLDAAKDAVYGALVFGRANYDYVLWTIQIEFLGSLLLFAYLALFGQCRFRVTIAMAVSVMLVLIEPTNGIFFALFFVGAFMHTWRRPTSPRVVVLCVLVGSYLGSYHWRSLPSAWIVRGADALIRLGLRLDWGVLAFAVGAVFVVWVSLGQNQASAFLSKRTAVWLGDKSFSLYLTHTLVLSSLGVDVYLWTAGLPYQLRAWISIAAVTLASLAVSIVFAKVHRRLRLSSSHNGSATSVCVIVRCR